MSLGTAPCSVQVWRQEDTGESRQTVLQSLDPQVTPQDVSKPWVSMNPSGRDSGPATSHQSIKYPVTGNKEEPKAAEQTGPLLGVST